MPFNLTVDLTAKNFALNSRRKFAVRAIFGLTVDSGRKIQHPCGFPGDRQVQPR
jgi:hypothetical protein